MITVDNQTIEKDRDGNITITEPSFTRTTNARELKLLLKHKRVQLERCRAEMTQLTEHSRTLTQEIADLETLV